MPPPTSTGQTLARYSSIRPSAAASAARVAPPIAMSPSPRSARNTPASALRPPPRRQAGIGALHRRQRRGEHHLGQRLPDRGELTLQVIDRWILLGGLP